MSNCNCNQGRLPCTCKIENACTCGASAGAPEHAGTCPEYRHFFSPRITPADFGASNPEINVSGYSAPAAIHVPDDLNASYEIGFDCDLRVTVGALRTLIISHGTLEADLYAAQDQVTGLQELMRTNTVPAILDTAVRYLVAAADSRYTENTPTGSPQHGHRIAGRWDGDGTNRKGALCEECAAWNILRKYAATDIVAEAQVIEDARVTQLLATLKRADGIISMLMPGAAKVFNLDIMELNEGMMEIAQALAIKKGAAQ